jgi:hypothetical protein
LENKTTITNKQYVLDIALINTPTDMYTDIAIGECYDKGPYCTQEDKIRRIEKVALTLKHSSVLEFTTFIYEITLIEGGKKHLRNLINGVASIDTHIVVTWVTDKKVLLSINARILCFKPLPRVLLSLLPENMLYLVQYKQIGDSDYVITQQSQVFRVNHHIYKLMCPKLIKPFINPHGYPEYILGKKHKSQHRAMMESFVPEFTNQVVNHKDEVTTNNLLDNLEWCSYSENEYPSYSVLGEVAWKKGKSLGMKAIQCYSMEGELLHTFSSLKEGIESFQSKGLYISCGQLSDTLNRKHKHCRGFIWKFV